MWSGAQSLPLDGLLLEQRRKHFGRVRVVVKRGGQQLAFVVPLLPPIADRVLVELGVGEERLNGRLVEATLLRGAPVPLRYEGGIPSRCEGGVPWSVGVGTYEV